ncbi:MAG TPA: FAD-dependent oxidoreductase [Saprospiraceae bacterium]|nr:FAD-dependent oxidoreductase [Saprospiraceae bacterium]
MRLRTFESFWLLKNGLLYTYPSVQKNISTEIVVIGGGITGALTSHALMDKGYKVTLIDKRDIGQGSSSATTSMLQYEIDVPLSELSNMIGSYAAAECYSAGIEAIKKLEQLVIENKIDCGFEKKESLYIAHSEKAAQSLKEEFEIRNKCELGVKWLSAEEVSKSYGLKSFGGILSETAASIDAYKLAHELIHYNAGRGMHVYDQTELIDFDFGPKKTTITSSEGHKISCKKVIFCSGFESTKMIKEDVAKLFYTYACVSEKDIKIPKKLRKTLVWDTNDPYLYMRTTDDGRLLVGGEDSSVNFPFFQQQIKESKTSKLIQTLQEMMPDINFIEDFSWGGTFGSTKDGLPYIGKSPEFEHALFVLSFGGNGITFSMQAMDIIVDLLEDKPNELADYYRFGR